jgi:hypothetical protein
MKIVKTFVQQSKISCILEVGWGDVKHGLKDCIVSSKTFQLQETNHSQSCLPEQKLIRQDLKIHFVNNLFEQLLANIYSAVFLLTQKNYNGHAKQLFNYKFFKCL